MFEWTMHMQMVGEVENARERGERKQSREKKVEWHILHQVQLVYY